MDRSTPILVTGGTGLVGSYLLRYLIQEGYTQVRAVRRPSSRMALAAPVADRVTWLEGDVLDLFFLEEAMQGVGQVYHCAAVVSFDPREASHMMKVNVEGTANVVNAALYSGVDKLVHVSSVAALGRTHDGETLTEQSFWQRGQPSSRYALSKFLSEQEVWRAMAEGLRAAIVNPSIILGSGNWDEGPLRFFGLAWKNFPFYPTGANGFVDVRDVARFMIRLMESDIESERYIVNAENMPYAELMRRIARLLDRRPPAVRAGAWLQELTWRTASLAARISGRRAFITRETARSASQSFSFDNHKSVADFAFSYTPLDETLAAACRQFREAAERDFPPMILPLI